MDMPSENGMSAQDCHCMTFLDSLRAGTRITACAVVSKPCKLSWRAFASSVSRSASWTDTSGASVRDLESCLSHFAPRFVRTRVDASSVGLIHGLPC